eukprot:6667228-Alexandrium_andersonii.AAC.1
MGNPPPLEGLDHFPGLLDGFMDGPRSLGDPAALGAWLEGTQTGSLLPQALNQACRMGVWVDRPGNGRKFGYSMGKGSCDLG